MAKKNGLLVHVVMYKKMYVHCVQVQCTVYVHSDHLYLVRVMVLRCVKKVTKCHKWGQGMR